MVMSNQQVGVLALPVAEAVELVTRVIQGKVKGSPVAVRVQAACKVLDLHAAQSAGKTGDDVPVMSAALFRALQLRHAGAQAVPGVLVDAVPARQESGNVAGQADDSTLESGT